MRLATIRNNSRDGALVAISPDASCYAKAPVDTLQQAIEQWARVESALLAIEDFPDQLDVTMLAAPLPRAWQWLDGSAFDSHGALMQIAFKLAPIETELPLMYQGVSDKFYGPFDDIPFRSEADGIDFEGEFGVIVNEVPMGTQPAEAMRHIRLIVQINDWSLRAIAPMEMKTGFGWIQAKPPCSMAPFAVTPDELGDAWQDGRVRLPLLVDWNGSRFGQADGGEMAYGFHELVAHAARTRTLVAGTIIGSGTVSNANYREIGSSCISERRAIEQLDLGAPTTGFMKFGDEVRMEARLPCGTPIFGTIWQKVVRSV